MTSSILSITDPEAINYAIKLLAAGEMIILPTDTIYGIAISPKNTASIARLYQVREREREPALPFLLATVNDMQQLVQCRGDICRAVKRLWPGALTVILSPRPELEPELRTTPVALRVPNLPPLQALLKAAGGYLIVTGAHRSGYPPAITAQEAASQFEGIFNLILDGGRSPYGIPSTILDCIPDPPVIVRKGVMSEEKIWTALNRPTPRPEVRSHPNW
ncbi:MAG: threonylcarbamoyl-AMP synthase [Anaerolineae bacterium]|nr:threonylcarbamoyl-AMP synthase [Anaerolineae bacterium]